MLGTDERERFLDARPDLRRLDPDVLEAECDLVRHPAHHDLVLGILKDRGHDSRELGGPGLTRIDSAHDHASGEDAAVEVRDEPCEGTEKRRLPRARRAEQQHVLAVAELERDAVEDGGGVHPVRKAQPFDDRYSHRAPTTIPTDSRSAA